MEIGVTGARGPPVQLHVEMVTGLEVERAQIRHLRGTEKNVLECLQNKAAVFQNCVLVRVFNLKIHILHFSLYPQSSSS